VRLERIRARGGEILGVGGGASLSCLECAFGGTVVVEGDLSRVFMRSCAVRGCDTDGLNVQGGRLKLRDSVVRMLLLLVLVVVLLLLVLLLALTSLPQVEDNGGEGISVSGGRVALIECTVRRNASGVTVHGREGGGGSDDDHGAGGAAGAAAAGREREPDVTSIRGGLVSENRANGVTAVYTARVRTPIPCKLLK